MGILNVQVFLRKSRYLFIFQRIGVCDGDGELNEDVAGREAIIEGDFYTLSDASHISTEYFYKPFPFLILLDPFRRRWSQ